MNIAKRLWRSRTKMCIRDRRNLYLSMQLIELNLPMVIALNMMDEMRAHGTTVDVNKLEEERCV